MRKPIPKNLEYPGGVLSPFRASLFWVNECMSRPGLRAGTLAPRPDRRECRGYVTVREKGREIQIKRDNVEGGPDPTPPTRTEGDISGFSDDSARRLRALFDRLRRDAPATFLTLTYHRQNPDPEAAKRHLHAFMQACRRRYDRIAVSVIWRMEWQENGTPHFHLLVYGLWWEESGWFKRTWHRITGEAGADRSHIYGPARCPRWGNGLPAKDAPGDGTHEIADVYAGPPHRGMGAWVEQMGDEVDEEKVRNYVQKYHCKNDAHAPPPGTWEGRHWGVRMRKNLPVAEISSVTRISYDLAYEAARYVLDQWGSDVEVVPYSLRISSDTPGETLNKILAAAGQRMTV